MRRRLNTFLLMACTLLGIWYTYLAHQLISTAELRHGTELALWIALHRRSL